MRTFLLAVTLMVMSVGCSGPFDPGAYMSRHNIESAADLTKNHENALFANVPAESRPVVLEKINAITEEAKIYYRDYYQAKALEEQPSQTEYPLDEKIINDSVNREWWQNVRLASQAMSEYPLVHDPKKRAEYWEQSFKDLCFCLDDRLERVKQKKWGPFLQQLTDEQKTRLKNGLPLFDNPYLGVATPYNLESALTSRECRHNPAQAYMLELRNTEIDALRVADTPELDAINLTVGDLERWDGSTSLMPLARILAAHAADLPWQWDRPFVRPVGFGNTPSPPVDVPENIDRLVFVGILGEEPEDRVGIAVRTPPEPTAETLTQKPDTKYINGWQFTKTHGAIVSVIDGSRDLALVSRMPSEDELALLKQQGVELEFYPFAKDAFVFIENRHNPVRDLTIDQARGIFSGKITKWKKVGGYGGVVILPFVRNRNSGSEELMRELVMKNTSVKEDLRAQLVHSMEGLFDFIEKINHGIGYTILYFDRYMVCSPFTRTIRINGVEPTPETVADGSYPLIYECVAVVRKAGPDKAKAVAKWLTSEEGTRVIRESGYVPVKAIAEN